MADLYQHHRMILRDTDTGPVTIAGLIHREPTDGTLRARAELIATGGHWPLVESNAGEADESYRCYLLWGITPELWMMYLEDRTTQTAAIEFFGTDGSEVAEIARRVTLMFDLRPYQRDELLTDAAQLSGREKVRAVLRIALALGSDDAPEYFGAILQRLPRPRSRRPERRRLVHALSVERGVTRDACPDGRGGPGSEGAQSGRGAALGDQLRRGLSRSR